MADLQKLTSYLVVTCTKKNKNKINSETADLVPCAATCRLGRNVFDSGQFRFIMRKHDVIDKTGSIFTLPSEEDEATATGNVWRNFGEIWTCGF